MLRELSFKFAAAAVGRLIATCLFALTCLHESVNANEFLQLSVGIGNEDNVPRAAHNPSAAESGLVTTSFTGGKYFQIGLNHSLTVAAQLEANRYFEHRGFDQRSASLSASYNYKYGFGAYAPRIGLSVTQGKVSLNGEARDRSFTTTEFSFEKRLSPSWVLSAGADYHVSRGESLSFDPLLLSFSYDLNNSLPYKLFNDDAVGLFAAATYEFANGIAITSDYTRTDGFTVSSTRVPSLKIYKNSKALYVDPAWPDLWFAYRLETVTDDWSLGISVPAGLDASINLEASWQGIDGPVSLDYRNRLLSISYVYNF